MFLHAQLLTLFVVLLFVSLSHVWYFTTENKHLLFFHIRSVNRNYFLNRKTWQNVVQRRILMTGWEERVVIASSHVRRGEEWKALCWFSPGSLPPSPYVLFTHSVTPEGKEVTLHLYCTNTYRTTLSEKETKTLHCLKLSENVTGVVDICKETNQNNFGEPGKSAEKKTLYKFVS